MSFADSLIYCDPPYFASDCSDNAAQILPQDVVEELSCKSDLIHLAPGAKYENQWSITITEEKECMM